MLPNEAAFAASGTCLIVQGTSNVWIGTGGGERARVFRSTDRGRTWSVSDTPLHAGNAAAGIFSVAFSDAQHGVVVGGAVRPAEGAVRQRGGDRGRRKNLASRQGTAAGWLHVWRRVRPGDAGADAGGRGLAGTASSVDGGESWTMVDSVAYNSVAFASRDAGWAVGPRGRIAKWETRR